MNIDFIQLRLREISDREGWLIHIYCCPHSSFTATVVDAKTEKVIGSVNSDSLIHILNTIERWAEDGESN